MAISKEHLIATLQNSTIPLQVEIDVGERASKSDKQQSTFLSPRREERPANQGRRIQRSSQKQTRKVTSQHAAVSDKKKPPRKEQTLKTHTNTKRGSGSSKPEERQALKMEPGAPVGSVDEGSGKHLSIRKSIKAFPRKACAEFEANCGQTCCMRNRTRRNLVTVCVFFSILGTVVVLLFVTKGLAHDDESLTSG